MNRKDFLKKLGLGLGVAVVAPSVLAEKEKNSSTGEQKPNYAVDINSIANFSLNGRDLCPSEVLELWRETGVLVYNSYYGHAPVVFSGELKVVDLKDYAS